MKPFTFGYGHVFVALIAVILISALFGAVIRGTGIEVDTFGIDIVSVSMIWLFALALGSLVGVFLDNYRSGIRLVLWILFGSSMPLAFMAGLGALAPWMIHVGNVTGFLIGMTAVGYIGIFLRKTEDKREEEPDYSETT